MKTLILIIAILIAMPPVQAGSCDMDQGQEAVQHAGMQHDGQGDTKHDCCDSDDDETAPDCSDAMQCGHCSIGAPAIMMSLAKTIQWQHSYNCGFSEQCLPPTHSSPPFRPPIA